MSKNIEIAKLATMSKTVAAEDDKTLHKYYVETGKLQDVCSGGQVVLGTKGSGKTALFMHAHDSLKKFGVVVVPFSLVNDFPLERQKMFKDENVSLVERYVLGWQYTLTLATYLQLKSSGSLSLLERAKLWWCYRRARRHDVGGLIERWLLRRLETSAKFCSVAISSSRVENPLTRNEDMRRFISAMDSVGKRKKFVVLIDGIDPIWDAVDEGDDRKRVIQGLVQAVRLANNATESILSNSSTVVKDLPSGTVDISCLPRIICFLRTDIFHEIEFSDRNKILRGAVNLRWNQETLQDIVVSRARYFLDDASIDWQDVVNTGDVMRSRQNISSYIWMRTFNRPRDIITFISFAAQSAADAGSLRIGKDEINGAFDLYSEHVLREFEDEYASSSYLFAKVRNVLAAIDEDKFTFHRWLEVGEFADEEQAKGYLFDAINRSIVGWLDVGGYQRGSRWNFVCFSPKSSFSLDSSFKVHPTIARGLNIKESRRSTSA